jgi:hypothetical protein
MSKYTWIYETDGFLSFKTNNHQLNLIENWNKMNLEEIL